MEYIQGVMGRVTSKWSTNSVELYDTKAYIINRNYNKVREEYDSSINKKLHTALTRAILN